MKILSIILFASYIWAQDAPSTENQATITTKKLEQSHKKQEIPDQQRVVFKFLDQNNNLTPTQAQLISDSGETIKLNASEGIYEKVLDSKFYQLNAKIGQKDKVNFTIDLATERMPMVLIRFNNL